MRGKMVKKIGCMAMAGLLFVGGTVHTSAATTNFTFNTFKIHCGTTGGTVGIIVTQAEGGGSTKCMAAIDSYQTMRKESGSVSPVTSGDGWHTATNLATASKEASSGHIITYIKGKHKAKNDTSASAVHYLTEGSKR